MIVEWLIGLGAKILEGIFMLLDILPDFPTSVTTVIDGVFDLLFAGVSVVGIFVDLRMIKILVPFVIVILNLDKLIKFIMFIIKKIPFLGME